MWEQRRLAVRYTRWDKSEVDRELAPLGLVLKNGTWYLVAVAAGTEDPRTFRISRILSVDVREPFTRPPDFDLGAYWTTTAERVETRLWKSTATVRLSPHGRKMAFLLGPVVNRALADLDPEPDDDGWTTVTLPIETHRHALHSFLQLGADLEVLDPTELRAMFVQAATALAERYT
ncbi:hypothetical protein GCM10029964_118490 [Kibdelosporangium lantanae]